MDELSVLVKKYKRKLIGIVIIVVALLAVVGAIFAKGYVSARVGVDVPFTTKSFIAKWDGSIKAGVKVENIVAEQNDMTKEIVVHIPKAEILSHEIDAENIETLAEKDGLFNPIKIDDVREFDAVNKEAMEKRAIENGILEKAFENAKDIIFKLINTDVVEESGYSIIFEVIEE